MIPSKKDLLKLARSIKESDKFTLEDVYTINRYTESTFDRDHLFYTLGYFRAINSVNKKILKGGKNDIL